MEQELVSKIVPAEVLKYSKKHQSFDNLNDGQPWDIKFSKITARPLIYGTWDFENWIEIAQAPNSDFLFMKAGIPKVFVYYHEEKIIETICESFEQLIAKPDTSPSKIPPMYYAGGQQVLVGDVIQYKGFFRTKKGVVKYVPGISPKNIHFERNGMAWVKIDFDDGTETGMPFLYETNTINKRITLISRATEKK